MRTSNPTLAEGTFNRHAYLTGVNQDSLMTLNGTINKTFLLLIITVASGAAAWVNASINPTSVFPIAIGSAILAFILAIVCSLKAQSSPFLAPIYAVVEGVFLGSISAVIDSLYPGIVMQAVPLTAVVAGTMLGLYRARILKASPMFVRVVVMSTIAIMLVYLASFVMSLMGMRMPYIHDATPLGIGISVFTTLIAALNLILDFDLIEKGVEEGAPKFMEWYGGFALLVTLCWLYWEILRLLWKIRSFME